MRRTTWRARPPRGATWHLGHVAKPGWPARGAGGTDAWQEATQTPCGAPRVAGYRGRKDNFNREIRSPI